MSATYRTDRSAISGSGGEVLATMSYQSDQSVKAVSFVPPDNREEKDNADIAPDADSPRGWEWKTEHVV